jgi:hypothetical protein
MAFKVMIEDNNHLGFNDDENHPYSAGVFTAEAEAITICEAIVNDFLTKSLYPGERAKELVKQYYTYGEDPYIVGTEGDKVKQGFSGWGFAEERSVILCTKDNPNNLRRVEVTKTP